MRRLMQYVRGSTDGLRRRRALPHWMRKGLLALTILAMVAGYFVTVAQVSRNGWIDAQLQLGREWLSGRVANAGFQLKSVVAFGASQTEADVLRAALAVEPGAPLLDLDLQALRHRVEALPWVRVASVERTLPDRLIVRVIEREPAALLQQNGHLALIDTTGTPIPNTPLSPFIDLPAVTGAGAATATPALLDLLQEAPALAARVTAATRLGERRWDVRIDDRVWVRLPEQQPLDAWLRLAELETKHGMLRRNLLAADIRNPQQWVFRLPAGMRLRMAIENNGS